MPWTEKQLRLFRAAAHDSAFAKRAGIKPEEAARMMKEGVKRVRSVPTRAKILKQNTGHGRVDMPYSQLNRFAGMKAGGVMKKRRFDEGGDVDSDIEYTTDEDGNDIAISRKNYAGGVRASSSDAAEAKPTAKPAPDKDYGDEVARRYSRMTKESPESGGDTEDTSAVSGRASTKYVSKKTPEEKERAAERLGEMAAMAIPVGAGAGVLRMAHRAGKAAKGFRDASEAASMVAKTKSARAARAASKARSAQQARDTAIKERYGLGGDSPFKKGGAVMRSRTNVEKDQMAMAPYRKGGNVKAMRQGGITSHGEHSVQKSGHTKGTVIKMAKGGFVRSADGCAQRGKTKGKVM